MNHFSIPFSGKNFTFIFLTYLQPIKAAIEEIEFLSNGGINGKSTTTLTGRIKNPPTTVKKVALTIGNRL